MTLSLIKQRLEIATRDSGRQIGDITLIAVSKVQPIPRIEHVLMQGMRIFGENRVQEAQNKWPSLIETHGPVDLHLLGPLQSNKTRAAMQLFSTFHSVDRPRLVAAIARIADEIGSCPDLFIQVNTGEESQKAGVMPRDVDDFVKMVGRLHLPVKGLMCIPPVYEDARWHFTLLRDMAHHNGLSGLSMGMSADFETAIAFGATHVRIGSAIFGDRTPPSSV